MPHLCHLSVPKRRLLPINATLTSQKIEYLIYATYRSRNVGYYQLTMRNIPEEWIPHLRHQSVPKRRLLPINATLTYQKTEYLTYATYRSRNVGYYQSTLR